MRLSSLGEPFGIPVTLLFVATTTTHRRGGGGMDISQILIGSTALGLVAGFWGQIKAALWKMVNLLIQQVEVPTEPGHEALIAYLIAHYRRSRLYDRMYGAWWEYRRDGRYGLVPYEMFGQRSMIFWSGWIPFIFANHREKKTGGDQNKNTDATKIYSVLTFVRGTLDLDKLLLEACAKRNDQTWNVETTEKEEQNRFVIHFVPKRATNGEHEENGWASNNGLPWYSQGHYRLIGMSADELGKARSGAGKALETLIFPSRIKDLIKEIGLWCKSRSWYHGKCIPWKRGWLLFGPPGTGKTALARAFAEDLNLPIYVFNLAEMGNHELLRAWNEMQVNVPCIALIEDIDNVFHGRENVTRKNGMFGLSLLAAPKKDDDKSDGPRPVLTPLTFDCLLNCLDGVERSDGVFTIITTNDIGKVDPALGLPRKLPDGTTEFISTRPGRIDKAVELTYMESTDKRRMAQRILAEYPDELESMLAFIDKYPDLQETPAQFQERCGQIALKRFWAEQEGVTVPREKVATWLRPEAAMVGRGN
jgi:hypothetical protein